MTDILDKPILIIGAGRSGTKLLRTILSTAKGAVHFPREINYIWRHGNALFPTDELRPEHARPEIARYIQNRFVIFQAQHNAKRVIEKTCANALRVEFIHAIFPDAYIVNIIRDGRAVTESSMRMWTAPPEAGYLLEKLQWVPLSDIPHYGLRWLKYQLGRLRTDTRSQSSWGPRFTGLDELVKSKALIEVCGIQWRECVEQAEAAMTKLPSHQTYTVRYEEIINAPHQTVSQLFEFLELTRTDMTDDFVNNKIRPENLGKWRTGISNSDYELLLPHIRETLEKHGYQL
jgi:hypothetical protein